MAIDISCLLIKQSVANELCSLPPLPRYFDTYVLVTSTFGIDFFVEVSYLVRDVNKVLLWRRNYQDGSRDGNEIYVYFFFSFLCNLVKNE